MKKNNFKRIAIVERDKCKSDHCNFECNRFCPIVRAGKNIVWLDEENKAVIDENLCIGCNICAEKCPFHAIEIVNLTSEPSIPCIHQYGVNAFRLYGIPIIKYGKATGVIGMNGAGKTTALNILAGKIKPNLGILNNPPDLDEIIQAFKGKEIQKYLIDLYNKKIRISIKLQEIHQIPKFLKGNVKDVLKFVDERGELDLVSSYLELENILNKKINELSGGELQRFAISVSLLRDADIYLIDEPCSYLDTYQRLKLAKLINKFISKRKTFLIVEHDFAVLDYLCEEICVIFGKPKVYGIVSFPYSTSSAINSYFEGYLPYENIRLRKTPIIFTLRSLERKEFVENKFLNWNKLKIELNDFILEINPGFASKGEVLGILGPNGTGKTTFIKCLAGEIKPNKGNVYSIYSEIKLSYKKQVFSFDKEDILVKEYLESINKNFLKYGWIKDEIIYPLRIDKILERFISELSGGEKQALMVAYCLLKDADIYLLDEPSAFLDIEQRITVAKLLKKFSQTFKKLIIVVEHDLIIQDFASDRLIIFEGEPGKKGFASEPLSLKNGFNKFLKNLGITFRRDPRTNRPRINKENSWLDKKQKEIGEYYYLKA